MNGNWRIEGGELISDSVNQSKAIWFGDPHWIDIDFSYECCRDNDIAAMGGNFRSDLAGHLGHFGMGMFGGPHKWCEIGFARAGEKWSRKNRRGRGFPMVAKTWYYVRVSCRGSDFTGSIDGQQIGHMTREDFPQGCVGFWAHRNGVVRFRNVKVTAPNGAVLWEGLPDLSLPAQVSGVPETPPESPEESPDSNEPPPDAPKADLSRTSDSDDGFAPLFNGKDLKGWIDAVDSFEVVYGVISRQAVCNTGNLLTKDTYGNCVGPLRSEFGCRPEGTAGCDLRSIDEHHCVEPQSGT